MQYSVVTTTYQSAGTIADFCSSLINCFEHITEEYEIIIVDDGSTDKSLDIALSFLSSDRNITVIELTRNFGHHNAMWTGLRHASGKRIVMIDSDLEVGPDQIGKLIEVMDHTSVDSVYGYTNTRTGALYSRTFGSIFYSLNRWLQMESIITKNTVTLRVMTDRFLSTLLQFTEVSISIAGLITLTGFHQKAVEVEKIYKGYSSYTFMKRMSRFITGLISFTAKPLYGIFCLGLLLTLTSFLYVSYLLFRYFIIGIDVPGYLTIVTSIWFLSGLTILSLGVISLYLVKIFEETKRRPIAFIKTIHKK